MYYYNDSYYNYDYLQHYGIKGMKWGVRRFQNKNGRLTNAGKKRYSDSKRTVFDEQLKNFKPKYTSYGHVEPIQTVTKVGPYSKVRVILDISDRNNYRAVSKDIKKTAKKAQKFLDNFDDDLLRENITKNFYDLDYLRKEWVESSTGKNITRERFKSLITSPTLFLDPNRDRFTAYYGDGGTYGYHTFMVKGSISDNSIIYDAELMG